MDIDRLRYMIDQIARNFEVRGHEAAVQAVADHIAKFWDPRMKAAMFADDPTRISPIARDAIDLLRRGQVPTPQTRATQFDTASEPGSDAG